MEPNTQPKSAAEILAAELNRQMLAALNASGLTHYLESEIGTFRADGDMARGYITVEPTVSFGVSVNMTFSCEARYDRYDRVPKCEVGMSSIGQHSASLALARSTLYAKAAQAAALFDAGAQAAYDSFQRQVARAEKAKGQQKVA